MAVQKYKTGPGTLTIGEPGAGVDWASQVRTITISPEEDAEDDFTVLSGERVSGSVTHNATLSVSLMQDLAAGGTLLWTWEHKGEVVPFEFTPNTAAGTSWSGMVRVVPISVGGDVDADAQSDFEWQCVGFPTPTGGAAGAGAMALAGGFSTDDDDLV